MGIFGISPRCAVLTLTLLCILLFGTSTFASQEEPIRDSTDATLRLELPDTIIIGEAFRLTFSVHVNQAITHYNDEPDKISIRLPQCCQVDSGDTKWYGTLDIGSSVSLSLIVHATAPCREFFEGYVCTGCYRTSPIVYETISRVSSKEFQIGDTALENGGVIVQDSSGLRIIDTYDEGPPPSVKSGFIRQASRDKQVEISLDSLHSGHAVVTCRRGVNNFLRIYSSAIATDSLKKWISPKRWRFDDSGSELKIRRNSEILLRLDESRDTVRLHLEMERDTVSVLLKLLSNSTISGTARGTR